MNTATEREAPRERYDVVRIDSKHSSTVEWTYDDLDEAKEAARHMQESDESRAYEVWVSDPGDGPVEVLWREGWS